MNRKQRRAMKAKARKRNSKTVSSVYRHKAKGAGNPEPYIIQRNPHETKEQKEYRIEVERIMNEPFKIDNLPDFIQEAAKQIGWRPQHKRCFGNCYSLGAPLSDMGHEVFYCEGEIAMERFDIPHTHAWLRVDGVDINVSGNGAPIHIFSAIGSNKTKLCIMPIEHMRENLYYDVGMSMTGWEYHNHKEVTPFIGDATPDRLTKHTTVSTYDEFLMEEAA
jgi:hypothetical protein|tara:strand:- start:440 stop:1099 length:660 start_codon:yes stop_codon:yes gene_type:complete